VVIALAAAGLGYFYIQHHNSSQHNASLNQSPLLQHKAAVPPSATDLKADHSNVAVDHGRPVDSPSLVHAPVNSQPPAQASTTAPVEPVPPAHTPASTTEHSTPPVNAAADADTDNGLLLPLLWYAPFLSGGGYCSEAIAFVQTLDKHFPNSLRIVHHGDSPSYDFVAGTRARARVCVCVCLCVSMYVCMVVFAGTFSIFGRYAGSPTQAIPHSPPLLLACRAG